MVTHWFEDVTSERRGKDSLLRRSLFHLAAVPLRGTGKTVEDMPSAWNAWICYRTLVDFVLANDTWTFFLYFLSCIEAPDRLGVLEVGQYLLGLFLIGFNYWAKVDAHRCIGDYCW